MKLYVPLLSVIVPVYNCRKYLRSAVTSLLKEEIPNIEIVVIDDGSTDGSCESVSDLPITLHRKENGGPSSAQNLGYRLSKGQYITFLDADDVLAPNGLRWRLEWLQNHPSESVIGGQPAALIDSKGNLLRAKPSNYAPPDRLSSKFYRSGKFYPVPSWLYLFRRSLVDQVGLFDEHLATGQDADYLYRILQRTTIPIIKKPVVYRRIHSENISVRVGNNKNTFTIRPQTQKAILQINARYGIPTGSCTPWEETLFSA